MKKIDLARAFRDEDYYLSLTAAERASLPAHPAAMIEVSEDELRAVAGATTDACSVSGICSPCPRRVCL
ncbi:MAG TPA: mersacidin/lichenicidin family type 2 lantibiotic [Thermoanaerobaculia bacterium]|nr:mersacidin/lichenicidin family type 2 lantibiotic [Thermoanaerobaculia bacterium]